MLKAHCGYLPLDVCTGEHLELKQSMSLARDEATMLYKTLFYYLTLTEDRSEALSVLIGLTFFFLFWFGKLGSLWAVAACT